MTTEATPFARRRASEPRLDEESLYLIEPYELDSPELLLDAVRGIVSNERAWSAPVLGPQRYLVKEPRPNEHGFRSRLERQLEARFGLRPDERSVFAVTSGTAALRLAVRALLAGRPRGSTEVLVPAVTVANTAEAVLQEGFVPVLVDVDPETWTLDPESAARALSPRTAALITVDWLGTGVDFERIDRFRREHGLLWISDSAQSFGIEYQGGCPAGHADATIFSTGYPKVFHTGGRGGLLVLAKAQAEALAADPAGALRNELLAEINSLFGLLLLPRFDGLLARRRELGDLYAEALRPEDGFVWQSVAHPRQTNRYQMSLRVDPARGGAAPAEIASALLELGVQASTERMKSLEEHARLRAAVEVRVPLPVSRELSASSLTLPMPQGLTPGQCRWLCEEVLRLRGSRPFPRAAPAGPSTAALLAGAAPERYWNVAELPLGYTLRGGGRRVAQTVLAPAAALLREGVSAGELLAALARLPLEPGQSLVPPFVVHRLLPEGDIVVDEAGAPDEEIAALAESGSSARVSLCLGAGGELQVRKRCDHDGIDGNGKPWLDLQFRYLETLELSTLADLFVKPAAMARRGDETIVTMPYVPSCSLAQALLGGAGEEFGLAMLAEVFGQLARHTWTQGVIESREGYLSRAHLQRMARRLKIAAERHAGLREVLALPEIRVNGQTLMGFDEVSAKILDSGVLARLNPPRLSLIHGDLNLYNVLCLLDGDGRRFKLIDPRGTPLWAADADTQVERGDFVYDLAKAKFSLGGFVAIRAGLMDLRRQDERSFAIEPRLEHLGIRTLAACDARFEEAFAASPFLRELRERLGERDDAWRQRLELAEAANFVADAACALGRDCPQEVLPLFLLGLLKLNHFHARCCAREARFRPTAADGPAAGRRPPRPAPAGLEAIQRELGRLEESPRWDVIEVLVRREAVPLARRILERAAGLYLPSRTAVYASHLPYPGLAPEGPRVLVHGVGGRTGLLSAVGDGIERTRAFLAGFGWDEARLRSLRILTLAAGGGPGGDHLFCRAGEPLLAAGPRDVCPLLLLLESAGQLGEPRPGRWVIGGGPFLLSQPPAVSGEALAVLVGETGLRELAERAAAGDGGEAPACFLPHALAERVADLARGGDPGLSLAGHLLSQWFLEPREWLARVRRGGRGHRAHEIWELGARLRELSPRLEEVSAGSGALLPTLASAEDHLAFFAAAGMDASWKTFLDLPRMSSLGRRMAALGDRVGPPVAEGLERTHG